MIMDYNIPSGGYFREEQDWKPCFSLKTTSTIDIKDKGKENAPAMHLQCTCNAPAMHLQCTCNALAMQQQCNCDATEMQLKCNLDTEQTDNIPFWDKDSEKN